MDVTNGKPETHWMMSTRRSRHENLDPDKASKWMVLMRGKHAMGSLYMVPLSDRILTFV